MILPTLTLADHTLTAGYARDKIDSIKVDSSQFTYSYKFDSDYVIEARMTDYRPEILVPDQKQYEILGGKLFMKGALQLAVGKGFSDFRGADDYYMAKARFIYPVYKDWLVGSTLFSRDSRESYSAYVIKPVYEDVAVLVGISNSETVYGDLKGGGVSVIWKF